MNPVREEGAADSGDKQEERAKYMIKLENIALMISKIIKVEEKRKLLE